MKNKLISILLSPAFIALVISLVIIYFLPDYFSKYKTELIEERQLPNNTRIYFNDLDGDNESEKIITQNTVLGDASFIVYNKCGDLMEQWNYEGVYPRDIHNLSFYDFDKDGFKEVIAIIQKRDSAFLAIAFPVIKDNNITKNIYIDSIGEFKNTFQLITPAPRNVKILNTGLDKELLFTLTSGFACYPRFAYKYNLKNDSISKSPYLVNHPSISHVIDINNSGTKEILLHHYSASNRIDTALSKRSDSSTWLSVLDSDLNYLFKPIEFSSAFATIDLLPIKNKENEYDILCLIESKQTETYPDKLCIYSNKGELIKEKILPKEQWKGMYKTSNDREIIIWDAINGRACFYNTNLKKLDKGIKVEPNSRIHPIDINNDNNNEWLVINQVNATVHIFDKNFRNPVSIYIPNNNKEHIIYGIKNTVLKNNLYFQKGNYYYVYNYSKNLLYILKYLVYILIFSIVLVFVWLIRKGQQINMEKKLAVENEISKLQLLTIKNNIDPHFVFNAVNTISEMILSDNKLEADRFISKFSKLMRETLHNSDRISRTLQEEIDFVENYIKLQKMRFNNNFEYKINIINNINLQQQVPKHVLYSYVENAIKHGLTQKNKEGMLEISVNTKGNNILLTVEDNGGGINSSTNNKNSTGNGIKIMEEVYKLCYKLYKKKITHTLIEVLEENGNKKGVRVEISILK